LYSVLHFKILRWPCCRMYSLMQQPPSSFAASIEYLHAQETANNLSTCSRCSVEHCMHQRCNLHGERHGKRHTIAVHAWHTKEVSSLGHQPLDYKRSNDDRSPADLLSQHATPRALLWQAAKVMHIHMHAAMRGRLLPLSQAVIYAGAACKPPR
jgi:hypothetical protein